MVNNQDKLQLLKSKYLEQVRNTERQLATLKAKLQVIEELEQESESLDGANQSNGKYKDLGLTEAALDAVQTIGIAGGARVGSVAQYLLSQGYQPKGNNFKTSLGTTLKRLAESKEPAIVTELKDGNRIYRPK